MKVLSETAKETDIVSNVVEETIISNSADSSDSLTTDSVVSRIQDLVNSNEEPKAQKALAFLRMILGKIVNNPKEPQLKKISVSISYLFLCIYSLIYTLLQIDLEQDLF